MKLALVTPDIRQHLADHYHGIGILPRYDVFKAVLMLNGTHLFENTPPLVEELNFMRNLELALPVGLQKLYMRELMRPANEFSERNGNCLSNDDYFWCAINASGLDRAKAYVRTGTLVLMRELYAAGEMGDWSSRFDEEFTIAAAEEGADREADFDLERWIESHWEDLFSIIEDFKIE